MDESILIPEHIQQHNLDTTIEFNALVLKAQKRAVEDKLTQYYKRLIDEKMYEQFHVGGVDVLQRLDGLQDICNNILDVKQGKNQWCFFTINFKENTTINEANLIMVEFTRKCKFVTGLSYIYSIEQRAEEGIEVGTHVHILFDKNNNPPSKIQRAFTTFFFDKYVGTHAALDWKYIGEGNILKDKVKYIMGIKKTEKMSKVRNDRILKDSYGLDYYVINGDKLTDIVTEIGQEMFNFQISI